MSSDKTARLIEWNVDLLKRNLQQIVARRKACVGDGKTLSVVNEDIVLSGEGETVIDEVREIIVMPAFDSKKAKKQEDPHSIELPDKVVAQLEDYVTFLARSYRNNVSQRIVV